MRRLPRALLTLLAVLTLCACGDKAQDGSNGEDAAVAWDALSFDKTMPLDYATQFSVSYAGDEYKRITIGQDQEFLLVAEGAAVPSGVPEGVTVLQQPLDEIYLVASAAMDSFAELRGRKRLRQIVWDQLDIILCAGKFHFSLNGNRNSVITAGATFFVPAPTI